ncbi:homeobox-leucine zipper protein [Ancistrocladus abbreviatus]
MASDNDPGLVLGLGFTSMVENVNSRRITDNHKLKRHQPPPMPPPPPPTAVGDEPSLTLSLSGDTYHPRQAPRKAYQPHQVNKAGESLEQAGSGLGSGSGSGSFCSGQPSPVSSFSTVVKRERGEETEVEKGCSRASDDHEDDDGNINSSGSRKKLRLTKEQSALLEESFKLHSTLNPKQKQALAHQLNLRPRQVEVWFQNRRARTKLKQTEADCEFLKKCCEALTDENRRLHKELQELKALKLAQPFYMQLPAATLTMCPSCERLGAGVGNGIGVGSSKTSFGAVASKSHHHLYNSFTNPPSAAC